METKHIMIKWHALREYKKTDVCGLRGYAQEQRYEIDKDEDGQWRCDWAAGIKDDGLASNTVYKMIAKNDDLFKVIQAAEEHLYELIFGEEYEDEGEYS